MRHPRFPALVILLCGGAAACSATPPAGDGEETARTSARAIVGGVPAPGFPEAVRIDSNKTNEPGDFICSGSLIAPRVVLTAGHCVLDNQNWKVTAPYAGGQTAAGTDGALFDYVQDNGMIDPSRHDVGLVFLDSPISLSAYPEIAAQPLPDGESVVGIGRMVDTVDAPPDMYVSEPSTVFDGADLASFPVPFDYAAVPYLSEPGDSGGMVVPAFASDPHLVVGVVSGTSWLDQKDKSTWTAIIARVDLVHDWIVEQVDLHGGFDGKGEPPEPPKGCAHDPCSTGKRLAPVCGDAVDEVCGFDWYCCSVEWDYICVAEIADVTGGKMCGCHGGDGWGFD